MPRTLGSRGSVLLLVLLLITALGVVVSAAFMIGHLGERSRQARVRASAVENAATSVLQLMVDRLAVTAALRLGELTQADLDALNANLGSLPLPAGVSLDAAGSGYRITAVRDTMRLPHDEKPLVVWPHQPRVGFQGTPPLGGMLASRTLEIDLHATVRDELGVRRSASQGLAVSQVPPFQDALYTAGSAELCAQYARGSLIGGTLRADGGIEMKRCRFGMSYVGSLESTGDIRVDASAGHWIFSPDYSTPDGSMRLSTVTRSVAEADPGAVLAAWRGRVRIAPALGGAMPSTRLQDAQVAGSGECTDFNGCGGKSHFSPSVAVQRTIPGPSTAFERRCGTAYGGGTACYADLAPALSYKPWPFASAPPPGRAVLRPGSTSDLWEGFFPDPRRESRCTAQLGSSPAWQTFRCPTNAYGFRLDLAELPEIPGGTLAFRRAINQVPGSNPSGFQEVLLIANARAVRGPLTIVSEIPVWVEGSLNVVPTNPALGGPQPLMIQAPRIGLLPPDAEEQLSASAVWDLVPPLGSSVPQSLPLQAHDNVTLYGVFRTGYCRTIGTAYYGGSWEGTPAVIGDWSDVGLRINGALQAVDETARGAGYCEGWSAPMNAPLPGGDPIQVQQPLARQVVFDARLLDTSARGGQRFQPPGSYLAVNTPAGGFPNTDRTPARQAGAFGGYTALRLLRPLEAGAARAVPASVGVPPPPPIPAPSPPLPMSPLAAFRWSANLLQVGFDASGSWDGAAPPLFYRWDLGDGTTALGVMPSHTYATGDDYLVTLTVTNAAGKQDTHRARVSTNRPPVPAFRFGPQPGRVREPVAFDAGATRDPDAGAGAYRPLRYIWNFGDGSPEVTTTEPTATTTHAYTGFGSFTVRLTVDDQRGGVASATRTLRIENRPPVACFSPDSLDAWRHQRIVFDARCSRDPDVGHTPRLSYTWSFGDGTSGTGARVSHRYTNRGIYTVTVTARDGFGGVDAYSGKAYVLNRAPVLVWDIEPDTATTDVTVTLDASGTTDPDGDPITFQWDFGDGNDAVAGQVATHRYRWPSPSRWVKLRADDGLGGIRVDSARVVISNRRPTARFGWAPGTIFTGTAVVFDGSSSTDPDGAALEYRWNFGDGTPGTGYAATNRQASHTFTRVGTYRVVLWVQDPHWDNGVADGNRDSEVRYVRVVNRDPTASFAYGPTPVFRGATVHFDGRDSRDPDLNQTLSYAWQFGNGQTAAGAQTSTSYSRLGQYTATLNVSDGEGGGDTLSRTVQVVNRVPSARISGAPNPAAVGATVRFSAASSADPDGDALTYHWTLGDGARATGREVDHSYGEIGRYTVQLTVADAYGGTDTATLVVDVFNTPPSACFIPTRKTVVLGEPVAFSARCTTDAEGDRIAYRWEFGDGTTASGRDVTHAYRARGTFTVQLTASDAKGGVAHTTGTITVANRRPSAQLTAKPNPAVRNQQVTLDGRGSSDPDGDALQYHFQFGDGTSSGWQSRATQRHAYRAKGAYTVTLTVRDAEGSTHAVSVNVSVVNQRPTVCFTPLTASVVRGQSIGFDASCSNDPDGDGLSYRWGFGDGSTSSSRSPTKSYSSVGSFTVRLTVHDGQGGSHSRTGTVKVSNRAPSADFTWSPSTLYTDTQLRFDGTLSGDPDGDPLTYQWNFGDGTTASGARPAKLYRSPGSYTVTLAVQDGQGGTASRQRTLRIANRAPNASFTYSPADPEIGEGIRFTSTSTDPDGDALTCAWRFDDGATSTSCSPTKAFSTTGYHRATLTVRDRWGATHSAARDLLVRAPAAPGVGWRSGATSGDPNRSYSMLFRLTNRAGTSRTYDLAGLSSNTSVAYVTGLSHSAVTLAPGAWVDVALFFRTRGYTQAVAGSTTDLTFRATDRVFSAIRAQGTRRFTTRTVRAAPSVTDASPYHVYASVGQWINTTHTVTNRSNRVESFSYSSATSSSSVVRSPRLSGTCTNIAPGATCTVTQRWYAGASGIADAATIAFPSGRSDLAGRGSFRAHVGSAPTVSYNAGATSTTVGNSEQWVRFYVHNPNGDARKYEFSGWSSNGDVRVTRLNTSSQTIGARSGAYVYVYYRAAAVGSSAVHLRAVDRSSPTFQRTGSVGISVGATYSLAVSPSSVNATVGNGWYQFHVQVTNRSNQCRYMTAWAGGFNGSLQVTQGYDRSDNNVRLCPGGTWSAYMRFQVRSNVSGTVYYRFYAKDGSASGSNPATQIGPVARNLYVNTLNRAPTASVSCGTGWGGSGIRCHMSGSDPEGASMGGSLGWVRYSTNRWYRDVYSSRAASQPVCGQVYDGLQWSAQACATATWRNDHVVRSYWEYRTVRGGSWSSGCTTHTQWEEQRRLIQRYASGNVSYGGWSTYNRHTTSSTDPWCVVRTWKETRTVRSGGYTDWNTCTLYHTHADQQRTCTRYANGSTSCTGWSTTRTYTRSAGRDPNCRAPVRSWTETDRRLVSSYCSGFWSRTRVYTTYTRTCTAYTDGSTSCSRWSYSGSSTERVWDSSCGRRRWRW